ncbi:Organ specific protein [Senna tora]|uniref:Organ specific protein n=1 Tax=Senna tora TaxID=362788 RepID=A0A834SVQ6_9FABA|nr:Organ specific protein [Senna tora]
MNGFVQITRETIEVQAVSGMLHHRKVREGEGEKLAESGRSRKDGGEYWRMLMKDEAMPQQVEGLLLHHPINSMIHQSHKKPNSHLNHECDEDHDNLLTTLESRSSLWNDHNNGNTKVDQKKKFADDFEPRPNASAYNNGEVGTEENKDFTKDFEPRPNASAYNNGEVGAEKNKDFTKDFEPRPNASAYGE